jgi:hypothetical protein
MAGRRLTAGRPVALIVVLSMAGMAAPATASAIPSPPPATARLQGAFELAGRVTVADNVPGERAGDVVDRIWTFTSACPTGPCAAVGLVRPRALAADVLVLHRLGPARYVGGGSFFAPLRCAGRVYPNGEKVLFTITVEITGAVIFGPAVVATRVSATYVNSRRINRTPCVVALGHDAASYHGHVIASQPAPAAAH